MCHCVSVHVCDMCVQFDMCHCCIVHLGWWKLSNQCQLYVLFTFGQHRHLLRYTLSTVCIYTYVCIRVCVPVPVSFVGFVRC